MVYAGPITLSMPSFFQHFKAGSMRLASKEFGEAVLWRCTCAKMVLVFYNGDLVPANF